MLSGLQTENQEDGGMGKSSRSPLQVSPQFKKRLDEIQKKIMMSKGEKKSLREITTAIVNSASFQDVEKQLIKSQDLNFDIKIKFDKRVLR